ncbi:Multidrug resistance protein Stp [Paenibacillus polymyxa E681]|uniref:MFS transporter n=1 Tax=Paenibacillus polymyxa TaxID=1406 RepID=UPI0001E32254|nr:MFS transporter [Paenibacillus polymyxa]ADM72654.1 MFS transporter [Paenibacillus polymyxa E681]QNV59681.1 Multidrug resistance protein Stp [Paenibacillus polymyxa E681]QNV64507.1 Multidrug resistance protein Stp [Paenibacillus polymyxa E681]
MNDRMYPWYVLSVTSLGAFLVLINIGTLNVALPELSEHFHASASASSWILLSYMLVNTIFILIFGQISDIFGRRRMYLIGMAIFTISSLLLGYAPNVEVLILLRIVQAAGGALVVTNTTPLITDAFPRSRLGTGLGLNLLSASVAQVLGPVVGGLVTTEWGWRYVFWSNVPFGIIALIWGLWILKENPLTQRHRNVDGYGGIMIFVALAGLIIALSEGGELGWGDKQVIGGFAVFAILIPIFLWHEHRSASPLLDLNLFASWTFSLGNIATFFNSFARTAVALLFALYYQFAFHQNALEAGLGILPITIGMLVISPIAGMLTKRVSIRVLASLGVLISIVGLLLLLFVVGGNFSYLVSACGMLLIGIGTGLFLTPNTTEIMSSVPEQSRGVANGLRSMLYNLGQVLSTTLSLTIVSAALPVHLKNVLYSGKNNVISTVDFALIINGYRWVIVVLIGTSLLALAASWFRPQRKKACESFAIVEDG